MCGGCAAKAKAARAAALEEYRSLTAAIANPNTNPQTIATNLPAIAERAGLDAQIARDLNWQALQAAFEHVLDDEIVTEAEEQRLTAVAAALGFGRGDFERAIGDFEERVFIARVNDGRLPVLESPGLMLKRGESAHLQTEAELMKEVAIRQYKGGSQGVSFRIAKGVSYRVGSHRGTMEVVGTRLETADSGTLTVTSQRAVFTGSRKSVEVRFDKLLSLNVYRDAIQFHVSNRQTPSLFLVTSGPMVAAAVNAAAQRLES
jgi:hypothetical protein